jgi:DNA gyrase subunit A
MDRFDEDYLERVFIARTQGWILVFTKAGHVFFLPVLDVPEGSRASRGQSLYALAGAGRQDPIVSVLPVDDLSLDRTLVFLTRKGLMKRTSLSEFSHPRAGGIIAAGVRPGDEIFDVVLSDGKAEVLAFSRSGRGIRFPEDQISMMGRTAQGMKGMGLRNDDTIVGMLLVRREAQVLTITDDGFGRRTSVDEFPLQKRGGLGTLVFGSAEGVGNLVSALEVVEGEDVMVVSAGGKVFRVPVDGIPEQHRRSKGRRLVSLPTGDRVVEVTRASGKKGKTPPSDRERAEAAEETSEPADQMELLS